MQLQRGGAGRCLYNSNLACGAHGQPPINMACSAVSIPELIVTVKYGQAVGKKKLGKCYINSFVQCVHVFRFSTRRQ